MNINAYKGVVLTLSMEKRDKVLNDNTIRCRCGKVITGKSKLHTESNLKAHQESKEHKKNMEFLK